MRDNIFLQAMHDIETPGNGQAAARLLIVAFSSLRREYGPRTCDASKIGKMFEAYGSFTGAARETHPATAELLAFCAFPGGCSARMHWAAALTGNQNLKHEIGGEETLGLVEAFGAIGMLGFSFPVWRFMARRFMRPDGTHMPALLEQFGMQRLMRASDKVSGTAADCLGTGFIKKVRGCGIEYRRSYLRASIPSEGTILIRNSSHFWGRDRFAHAAYFAPLDIDPGLLMHLTPEDVNNGRLLTPLTAGELWETSACRSNALKLRRLVNALREFDERLFRWFFNGADLETSPGLGIFLRNFSREHIHTSEPVPVLGFIEKDMPAWFPRLTLECGSSEDTAIREKFLRLGSQESLRLVLLSSSNGDFPCKM